MRSRLVLIGLVTGCLAAPAPAPAPARHDGELPNPGRMADRDSRGTTPMPVATSHITVAYYAQAPAFSDPSPLRVRLGLTPAVHLRGGDLAPIEAGPWLQSPKVPVPASGALPVLVAYVTPAGDTLARSTHTLALAAGYGYGVTIHAGGRNPAADGPSICGGKPHAIAVRRPGALRADSLYISIGGLPHGAVC